MSLAPDVFAQLGARMTAVEEEALQEEE